MKRAFIVCLALLVFSTGMDAGSRKKGSAFEGVVYVDGNGNGVRDEYEAPIRDIAVSDGFSIVKTDSRGRFSIPRSAKGRFITVYTPSEYVNSTPYYIDVRGEAPASMEFGLKSVGKQEGKFAHLSDIEERVYLDWMDSFKHFVSVYPLDFVAVTGDICYTKGLALNGTAFNTPQVGVRMVYTMGNHDLIRGFKDSEGRDYGEKLYEDNFGPIWYSFNVAGVHYMVTPMLMGDAKPSFTTDDVYNWMRMDLATIPEGTPVVIFNHAVMGGGSDLFLKTDNQTLDLSKYNVIGYIYGHNHINYHYRNDFGCQLICSVAPNKGGNDHSPASFRIFSASSAGPLENELHYCPMPLQLTASSIECGDSIEVTAVAYDGSSMAESVSLISEGGKKEMERVNDIIWKVKAPKCNKPKVGVLFSDGQVRISDVVCNSPVLWSKVLDGKGYMGDPIISGDMVYVPVIDDEMSNNCGVYALDKNTGNEVWSYKTSGSVRNNMALYGDLLFAADVNCTVYAIETATGKLRWSQTCRGEGLYPLYSQGVSLYDGVVYMGQGKYLKALKAEDGSVIWENNAWSGGITDVSTYTLCDGALIGNAYWVGRYCQDASTGELLWIKKDQDNRYSTSKPNPYGKNFIYTTSYCLMEISARTGEVVKRVQHPHVYNTPSMPVIADSMVVVGTSNHGMTAYKLSDFSQVWNYTTMPALVYTSPYTKTYEQTIETTPVIWGDKVIFGANDGYIYCCTLAKGEYVWRYNTGLPVLATPVIDGDYLYIIDMGGCLKKLDLKELK